MSGISLSVKTMNFALIPAIPEWVYLNARTAHTHTLYRIMQGNCGDIGQQSSIAQFK